MNTLNISKNKFESLKPLEISKEVFNTEGVLYEFRYRGKVKVLKKLHNLSEVVKKK